MKTIVIALVNMLVIASVAMTGEIERWRQHQILCCQSGSAVRGQHRRWNWEKKRPEICGDLDVKLVTKELSVASVLMIVVGIIACIGCHI